ncbi:hypothetical protein Daus18300_009687 [Diaporthe australafricana]|uniref:C2H2-type domain-containing protein n=1 Tax=Diaporthe australafricana TaxID=127596 RepID=A0ABR3WDG0_9PEZI
MFRRVEFENDAVAWRATNPSSFGYHHGPVPYWNPQRVANAGANANHANHTPAFLPITVPKVNTSVCDIEIDGTRSMCGTVFNFQHTLRRHLRDAHPGAANNTTRVNVAAAEKLQGEMALKRWVLTGGWRDASYVREPGRGPEGGLVAQYADACERIAREDQDFRRKFGEKFHREIVHEDPDFQPGRKSRARRRQLAAGAEAAEPQPQRGGQGRTRRPSPRRGSRSRVREVEAQTSIFISDDEEEDVRVDAEKSP